MDFPQHTVDLAKAIKAGDLAAADMALDLMVRDGEKPTAERVAKGRAYARMHAARSEPAA